MLAFSCFRSASLICFCLIALVCNTKTQRQGRANRKATHQFLSTCGHEAFKMKKAHRFWGL